MINGIMIVDKEAGYTSHDVVARLRGICGQKRIGHTGTLDPEATGVLPVCLGSGTRLCDMLTDRDKEYVAELLLGTETDTQDATGTVLAQRPVLAQEAEVRKACEGFLGEYEQIPPMYSALKVGGKKLYELARAGVEVERKARKVSILELEILECSLPRVKMRVVCSKGTYIRTLCADIGSRLGCGGIMQSLRRTAVGRFRLEDARTLDELQRLKDEGRLEEAVIPSDRMFEDCPFLHVREPELRFLENGNPLFPQQTGEGTVFPAGQRVRIYRPDGSFAGIYAYEGQKKQYMPVKMFL